MATLRLRCVCAALCTLQWLSGAVEAATAERITGTFNGIEVDYRVLLPDGFDASRPYVTVLHFAGGPQSWEIVERSTDTDWRPLIDAHALIVVSPAAPGRQLYFERGDRIFPAFIDHILATYPVADGRLHITGHSNGGLSAFHIASLHPEHVVSVTGYPGLLRRLDDRAADALAPLCLFMHVGDRDPTWLAAMKQQYEQLGARGLSIQYVEEPGHVHRLDTSRDGLRERLYAEIESSRHGCEPTTPSR